MKLKKFNMKVNLMENRLLKMEIAKFLLHKIKVHNKILTLIGFQCLYKITSSSIKMILKQMAIRATLKEMLKKLSKITLKKLSKITLKKLSKMKLKKLSKIMLKKLNKITLTKLTLKLSIKEQVA